MTNVALRSELKNFIDFMPDKNLSVLKPILTALSVDPVIIETDLTPEEKAIIEAGEREYAAHPETFIRLEDI
jgi:hypothetical protein